MRNSLRALTAILPANPACHALLRQLVRCVLLAGAVCTLPGEQLHAQDRMFRRYAAGQGFNGAPVSALAQDARGFLWIGGQNGLYRYDGIEFRRWAGRDLDGPVLSIATSTAGRLVVLTADGVLYEIVGDSARAVATPLPPDRGQLNALAFDADNRLWMVRGGAIGFLDGERGWRILPADVFGGDEPRLLHRASDGRIGVGTWSGIWQADPDAAPVKLLESNHAPDFTFLPGGGVAATDSAVRVLRGGKLSMQDPFAGAAIRPRPIALAHRGEVVWASYDRYLVAIRPDQSPEVIGPEHGVESGGPLLVDHEGSLWMGTFTALLQYPEPETRIWNERSGLLSQHTRFVGRSGNALWVTTWQGTVLLDRRRGARWLHDTFSQSEVCEDAGGSVWLAGDDAVITASGAQVLERHAMDVTGLLRCARDPQRGAWLSFGDRLYHADARGIQAVAMPPLPDGADPVLAVLHDSRSGLWIGGDGVICRGVIAGYDTVRPWECTRVPTAGAVIAFFETRTGGIWAATSHAGVLQRRGDAWVEAPGNAMLPSRSLLNLIPSPTGGVWLLGHGVVWRVEEANEDGAWHVRERLGEWHGLPVEGGRDLHEDPDGTLWITTSLGVIEVPASARHADERPPPVALVQALVDEEPVGIIGSVDLPHDRNRLEVRFAGLSFRDPGRLRYQVRLSADEPWRETTGRPWFRWIDLPARAHRAELRASLDGEHWTAQPASFSFRVQPPWYRTWWAITLFTIAASVLLWIGYRTRVGYLLGLERERTRIAMDLHDEMGSGLGSIGILSGLLASRGLDDGRGRELADRIAHTAEDLGGSLSNIIWSLDARPATLGELASRLAESGVDLLAPQGVAFRTEFPERWPSESLSARARRNLLLIGLEALHNAARHAQAGTVILGMRRSGRQWEMRIADDGIGFDANAQSAGHGLASMRRRAEEIGGSIKWRTRSDHGTSVVIRFSLAQDRVRSLTPMHVFARHATLTKSAAATPPVRYEADRANT